MFESTLCSLMLSDEDYVGARQGERSEAEFHRSRKMPELKYCLEYSKGLFYFRDEVIFDRISTAKSWLWTWGK